MRTEQSRAEAHQLLAVALHAARDAAEVHGMHLGRVALESWAEKGAADFVTYVDTEAEARILERIHASFPDHAVLAEEGSAAATAAPDRPLWIVDPLDGTTNFLHGYPAYSASVAVALNGELLAGAVVSGATGQAWTATRGGGAFLDGAPIRVSALTHFRHALIGTGFPFKHLELLPEYLEQFRRVLPRTAGIRRGGSAALDLCHVATGWFDGFWELWLAPWDVAAGALILTEAGGTISRLDGGYDVPGSGAIVAGNAVIHPILLETLLEDSPADG